MFGGLGGVEYNAGGRLTRRRGALVERNRSVAQLGITRTVA